MRFGCEHASDRLFESWLILPFIIGQTFVWKLFFVAHKNWFFVLLIPKKTSSQDVEYVLRVSERIVLTTSDESLDGCAHLE